MSVFAEECCSLWPFQRDILAEGCSWFFSARPAWHPCLLVIGDPGHSFKSETISFLGYEGRQLLLGNGCLKSKLIGV